LRARAGTGACPYTVSVGTAPCGRAARKWASPWATTPRLVIARAVRPAAIQTAVKMPRRSRKTEPPHGLPRRAARAMTEFPPSGRGEYRLLSTAAAMNRTSATTRQTPAPPPSWRGPQARGNPSAFIFICAIAFLLARALAFLSPAWRGRVPRQGRERVCPLRREAPEIDCPPSSVVRQARSNPDGRGDAPAFPES
jgi:hypothetical protein